MLASDTRTLPNGNLALTVLGLGCAQMGNLYRVTSREEAETAFDAAWEAGIRYFDTAPYYGHTRSERRLGTLLTDHPRSEYVVSTKAGRVLEPDATVGPEANGFIAPLPFRPVFDYTHDGILRAFDDSCQRLGIIDPDILYIHDIGRAQHGELHDHYWHQITTGGGFRALRRLREEKGVRAIGLGVNEWPVIRAAMDHVDIDVAMLAGRYTLLEQESLAFLNHCLDRKTAIVIAGVYNSGILAGNRKFNYADAPEELVARVEGLDEHCRRHGVSLQTSALRFALAHPAVASVVVGARNGRQIAENVDFLQAPVPDAFWKDLREAGLVSDEAPLPFSEA
jgi:D-threo-aldose 1-dehydrogenase